MSEPYPVITRGDKQAVAWAKLMARCATRLETLRSQLEGDQGEESTAKTRGRIAEVRAIMALDKDTPQEVAARTLQP